MNTEQNRWYARLCLFKLPQTYIHSQHQIFTQTSDPKNYGVYFKLWRNDYYTNICLKQTIRTNGRITNIYLELGRCIGMPMYHILYISAVFPHTSRYAIVLQNVRKLKLLLRLWLVNATSLSGSLRRAALRLQQVMRNIQTAAQSSQ